MTSPTTPHPRSDIGRRAAARRDRLGLTREEVAERSGSAPSYIEYLEEHVATPGVAFLTRLANALETTVQDLTGYAADQPPGSAQAGRNARLTELGEPECLELLGEHGIGRIAVTTPDGPAVIPVNYQVVDGEIVFVTAADSTPARAAGTETAFETDYVDAAFSQGWSVLVVGQVHRVADEATIRRLKSRIYSQPWAGGDRDTLMVLTPHRVTGRRIGVSGAPGDLGG